MCTFFYSEYWCIICTTLSDMMLALLGQCSLKTSKRILRWRRALWTGKDFEKQAKPLDVEEISCPVGSNLSSTTTSSLLVCIVQQRPTPNLYPFILMSVCFPENKVVKGSHFEVLRSYSPYAAFVKRGEGQAVSHSYNFSGYICNETCLGFN
jgi:hypothetical protein